MADSLPKITPAGELIMMTLYGTELYGYQIMSVINTRSRGQYRIGFATLYPALNRLEKTGIATSRWSQEKDPEIGIRRRYYKLTDKGDEVIEKIQAFRQELFALTQETIREQAAAE